MPVFVIVTARTLVPVIVTPPFGFFFVSRSFTTTDCFLGLADSLVFIRIRVFDVCP